MSSDITSSNNKVTVEPTEPVQNIPLNHMGEALNMFRTPCLLPNPQDNEDSTKNLQLSMAGAARQGALLPKPDCAVNAWDAEADFINESNDSTSMDVENRPSVDPQLMTVSFKPNNIIPTKLPATEFDMSFGGQRLMQEKKTESTELVEPQINKEDLSKSNQSQLDTSLRPAAVDDEFLFSSTTSEKA